MHTYTHTTYSYKQIKINYMHKSTQQEPYQSRMVFSLFSGLKPG